MRTDRHWDDEAQKMATDTTTGFYNVFDFDVGLSFSTKIYGFFTPLKKLFPNSKVEKFRHVMTPTLSISYHPDFGKSFWGYYGLFITGTVWIPRDGKCRQEKWCIRLIHDSKAALTATRRKVCPPPSISGWRTTWR